MANPEFQIEDGGLDSMGDADSEGPDADGPDSDELDSSTDDEAEADVDVDSNSDSDSDSDQPCPDPLVDCDGECVDLDSDPDHCGGCFMPCDETCVDGMCIPFEDKLVFVSSELRTGDMGGLAGADAFCNARAAAARLPGTYKAWLSNAAVGPAQTFTHSPGPYRLLDGMQVASSWRSLTSGSINHPINRDEFGESGPADNPICGGHETWTNTMVDGNPTSADDCSGWTQGGANLSADTGRWSVSTTGWTQGACEVACGQPLPVYCFQQ